MTLNKQMHPRNPFKNNKPDFKALASKYEEFRKHVSVDLKGRVHLDFKKPECLRSLSWALLKDLFGLEVDMPLDRLVPTIPLRLNYILWLEDLLSQIGTSAVRGIDVGTGASCVYPLIATKKNGWCFLATEADPMNFEFARRNVEKNGLEDKVSVMQVSQSEILLEPVIQSGDSFDVCMCNPPFFGSNFEAWGMTASRSEARPEPKSVCTASPAESIYPGGEVEFVRHMISDSHELKEKVRIYTSMLGKKSSLTILKEDLKRTGVPQVATTEFCQGRTMRWGLAWSFDPNINLASASAISHVNKPRPPVVYTLPRARTESCDIEYSVEGVCGRLIGLLRKLQFQIKEELNLNTRKSWQISAAHNTWSHQRRKRRQKAQESVTDGAAGKRLKLEAAEAGDSKTIKSEDISAGTGSEGVKSENTLENSSEWVNEGNPDKDRIDSKGDKSEIISSNKDIDRVGSDHITRGGHSDQVGNEDVTGGGGNEGVKSDNITGSGGNEGVKSDKITGSGGNEGVKSDNITGSGGNEGVKSDNITGSGGEEGFKSGNITGSCRNEDVTSGSLTGSGGDEGVSVGAPSAPLLHCRLCLHKEAESVVIEMEWLDGEARREGMYQVLQYIKNHLLAKAEEAGTSK